MYRAGDDLATIRLQPVICRSGDPASVTGPAIALPQVGTVILFPSCVIQPAALSRRQFRIGGSIGRDHDQTISGMIELPRA